MKMQFPTNTLVPKNKRIEVYQKALRILKSKRHKFRDAGLCIVLPCVLWNLNHYMDDAPNGEDWSFMDTVNLFPEIEKYIPKINRIAHYETARIQLERINAIEEILKKLTNEKPRSNRKTTAKNT